MTAKDSTNETLFAFYLRTLGVLEVVMLGLTWPAWIAHEFAHYVTARWAQLHPKIRLRPFPSCEYDYPAPIYVRLAPTFHGLLIFVVYIASRGVPELTLLSTVGMLWWAVYTYPSASDRNPTPVQVE